MANVRAYGVFYAAQDKYGELFWWGRNNNKAQQRALATQHDMDFKAFVLVPVDDYDKMAQELRDYRTNKFK